MYLDVIDKIGIVLVALILAATLVFAPILHKRETQAKAKAEERLQRIERHLFND